MKIKAKKYEPCYKKIKIDNYEFLIDEKQSFDIDGYLPIMATKYNDDNSFDLITTILDKNYKNVIPLRVERVYSLDYSEDDIKYDIMIFEKDKCIYILDKICYLIDLKNTEFNGYDPVNYLRKFDCLYNCKNGNAIIYENGKSYLLDVANNKKLSKVYDYIKPTDKSDLFEAYYLVPSEYFYPLFAKLKITYNKVLSNKVDLGNTNISLFVDDKILNNKKELLKYCDSCYVESLRKGDSKCKMLIQ